MTCGASVGKLSLSLWASRASSKPMLCSACCLQLRLLLQAVADSAGIVIMIATQKAALERSARACLLLACNCCLRAMQAADISDDASGSAGRGGGNHNGIQIAFDAINDDGGAEVHDAEREPLVSSFRPAPARGDRDRPCCGITQCLFLIIISASCLAAAIVSLLPPPSTPSSSSLLPPWGLDPSAGARALPLQRLSMHPLPPQHFALVRACVAGMCIPPLTLQPLFTNVCVAGMRLPDARAREDLLER